MSNLSNKENNKALKNNPNLNDINNPTNEFITKRKRLKLKSNKIDRRTLFMIKNKFLMEDPEQNKENELIIKSNDFFSRKNDNFYNYIKKFRNNYMNSMKISSETNKDLFFNNILDFKPLTDRNKKNDISERGFMLKKDYELNNLIIKKNKRAKTSRAKSNRIDKSINVMEHNLDQYIKSENNNNLNDNNMFNINHNLNNNNYIDLNNIAQSSSASYLITDLNEEDIISKKKVNLNLKNKARSGNMFNDITHKILFIDNKNNFISKDNIINLLKEEENLIIKKIKNDFKIKNFSKFIETKEGRKIILPILFRNIMDNSSDEANYIEKENLGAFLTSINKDINKEKDLKKKAIDNNYFYLKGKKKTLSIDFNHINNNIMNNFNYKNDLEENKDENNNMPNTTRGYENEIHLVKNTNTSGIINKNKNSLERNRYEPYIKFKFLKLNNLTQNHEEFKKSMTLNKNLLDVKNHKLKTTYAFEKNKLNLAQDKFNRLITLTKKEKNNSFNKKNNYIYYKNVYLNFNSNYLKSVTKHIVNLNEVNQIDNLHYFPRDNNTQRNKEKALKKLFEQTAKRNFNRIKIKNKGRNKTTNEDIKQAKTSETIVTFKQEQKDSDIEIKKREKSIDDKSSEKNNENEMKENNSNLDNSQIIDNDDSPKIKQNNEDNLKSNSDNNNININNNLNKKIEINKASKESPDISNSEENSSGEDESEEEKNEINNYPRMLPLLIKFIKDIIIKVRKKEEINNYANMKEETKKSYEMFKKQIDLADKAKKPKIKRLFSEMHYSNRDEQDHKIKRIVPNSKLKNILKFKKEPKKKEIILKDKTIDEEENKISNEEKNQLLIDEINLINEIKVYMSTIDDPENQKKFENLLKQIESYKKMDDKDYIKKLKENFGSLKEEISDRFRVKEIEDRINGFVSNLDKDIDKFEVKRSFCNRYINIVDHKFKSTVNPNF